MQLSFDNNQKILNIKYLIPQNKHSYKARITKINNTRYSYNGNKAWSKELFKKNYCKYSLFNYIKFFDLKQKYHSYYRISKYDYHKTVYFIKIPSIEFHVIYSYFIYNKYYSLLNMNDKYYTSYSIYSYKLFNSRDLYKLISYI